VCFADGNDELARKVIKRQLETERFGQHIGERKAAVDAQLATRRIAIGEQREQLDVMRQKAEILTAASHDERAAADVAVSADEVEVALLRERQKRRPS
jgi:hypothetical protein